jgi:hypothetical protein
MSSLYGIIFSKYFNSEIYSVVFPLRNFPFDSVFAHSGGFYYNDERCLSYIFSIRTFDTLYIQKGI